MPHFGAQTNAPVVCVTGGAHRIGKAIVQRLHAAGFRVVVHANHSRAAAEALVDTCNRQRMHSAALHCADFMRCEKNSIAAFSRTVIDTFGRLDALVHNAAIFPNDATAEQTDTQGIFDCFAMNAITPVRLSRTCAEALKAHNGCIVHITDLYAARPKPAHMWYSMSKAALAAATIGLAQEFAPEIRVNAVAPGAILPPSTDLDTPVDTSTIALQRRGNADDIAGAVHYLLCDAPYVTGTTITVDGGKYDCVP